MAHQPSLRPLLQRTRTRTRTRTPRAAGYAHTYGAWRFTRALGRLSA